MATFITGDVIALSTITPSKFTQGFVWDTSGSLSGTAFVGDGSGLTGLAAALSSVTSSAATFDITPAHNNSIIYFNNSGGTSVDIPFDPSFKDGHKTTIVQQGIGQVLITPSNAYSQSGFKRTRKQYSVIELEYLKNLNEWSLYGDLGVGPTYALNASTATVNEGASVTITLNTTLLENGTLVGYNIPGTITTADLSGASAGLTGNFTINNNSATRTFFLSSDNITEGQELINLFLNNNEASISVPVIDTSNNSTYSLTRSVSSADEGASVIITLTAPAVPNGTNVPYTVTGINGADLSSGSLTGNFTVNSGTATQTFTFTSDQITEGNETMVLTLNNGLASISVLVLDTSKTPAPSFTQIARGFSDDFSLALSGTILYAAGDGSWGRTGFPDQSDKYLFTKVEIPTNGNFTSIRAGKGHSLALSGTDLYVTGYNADGALGLGDTVHRSTFTRVPIFANIMEAGEYHSFVLSGTDLYATGRNDAGQLGLNDLANRFQFTKVTIPANAKWTAINTYYRHCLALSGTDLYACGDNRFGQLGFGGGDKSTFTKVTIPVNAKWTSIAAGWDHSLALSGTDLYAAGANSDGSLGLNDTVSRATFTKVPGNWTACVAGFVNSFALSGTDLYACGWNEAGQLGLGDTVHRSTFTKVPGSWNSVAPHFRHCLALSGTALYGTGVASNGALGLENILARSTFTQVTAVG
jgi:alpha-tubulin suppressor-like RCC1 family protein